MGLKKFNDKSEKAKFIYKPNQLVPHSWHILYFFSDKEEYQPVGEYTLIDTAEPFELTEKKLITVVGLLNERHDLASFSNLTKKRLLFNIVPKRTENDPTKIIFRSYSGAGVSEENAVLILEKGVLNESKKPI